MSSTSPKKLNVEFVLLMAFMTSIMALGIDAVLPALSFIEDDLNIDTRHQGSRSNSVEFL